MYETIKIIRSKFKNHIKSWDIKFIESTHDYLVNGVKKWSVSKFIEHFDPEFLIKKEEPFMKRILAKASFRGTTIHKLSEKIELNFLQDRPGYNLTDTEKEYMDYVIWYKEFFSQYIKSKKYYPIVIEGVMYHDKLNICGTIDRLYFDTENWEIVLADIKTGATRDNHWRQQVVYKEMLENIGIKVDRIELIVIKDGMAVKKMSESKIEEIEEQVIPLINETINNNGYIDKEGGKGA